MTVTCLECGTDFEMSDGTVCPKCKTPPSQFVHLPPGDTTAFEPVKEGVRPLTGSHDPMKTVGYAEGEAPHPERVGKYEILARAGAGGMGVVYKARDRELDRIVALKVMIAGEHAAADTIQRFQREARAAARLSHPNIVHVYEVGTDPSGLSYFAMEFVDGVALDKAIRDPGFDPPAAARIVRDVARALHTAHAQGIVHRDIKPANVMIDKQGVPRLTDFGLAKHLADEHSLTRPGEIMGTACYMPPEQAVGMRDVDQRSDIYSLGAVLYEMLTRRPPFVGETVVAILRDVEERDPDPPTRVIASVPRDLETICLKAMAKEKDRRYATAAELADDLDRFLSGQPVLARPSGVLYRATKWSRRHPAALTAIAMSLAGILAVAFVLSRQPPPPPPPPPPNPGPDRMELLTRAKVPFNTAAAHVEMARRFKRAEDRKNRQEVYKKALAALDQAIGIYPEYAEAFTLRGSVRAAMNQPAKALEDFDRALQLDPSITDAYYERVALRLKEVGEKIVRGVPFTTLEEPSKLFAKDRALVAADIEALRKLGLRPERALVAQAGAIVVFREDGDPIELLDEALAANPTFADALVMRAQLKMDQGGPARLKEAMEDADAAIGYDANLQRAYKVRAALHFKTANPTKAVKDLDELVAIAPDEAQSYVDRAIVLLNDPRPKSRRQIVEDLDRAIGLDPGHAMARFLRGVSQLSDPRADADAYAKCREEFLAAIRAEPDFVAAYAFRMVCDLLLMDPEFETHFQEFEKRFEGMPREGHERAKSLIGGIVNSIRVKHSRTETQRIFDSGCERLKDGEPDEAEAAFLEVLRRLDDPLLMSREGLSRPALRELRADTQYNLACVHALRRERDRAFEWLEGAFRSNANLVDHAKTDADLESLREDPRFEALLRRYRKE